MSLSTWIHLVHLRLFTYSTIYCLLRIYRSIAPEKKYKDSHVFVIYLIIKTLLTLTNVCAVCICTYNVIIRCCSNRSNNVGQMSMFM